jgi:PhnB protein
MSVNPYLMFNGSCEEALNYYKKALGAEVTRIMRFKDNPEPPPAGTMPPGIEDKVMHCEFRIGDSVLMATDGCPGGEKATFKGISLTLSLNDVTKAKKVFDTLVADGGQAQMPFNKTFFSPGFGVASDRFGVSWMILTCPPQN